MSSEDLLDRLADKGHAEYVVRVAIPVGATPEQVEKLKAAGVTEALATVSSLLPAQHTWILNVDTTPVDSTLTLIWVGIIGSHTL